MKKFKFILLLIVIFSVSNAYAIRSRKDYFLMPQIGAWFGPITPVYTTEELLEPAIGAGLFFRYNTPLRSLKIGLDTSYQDYDSAGVNEAFLVPIYANLIYLLPINIPVKLQAKLGAGTSYIEIKPDKVSQWDPLFVAGMELSFPAGRILNIGLRIDYHLLYEGYIEGATENGHFITAGFALYFNLNL